MKSVRRSFCALMSAVCFMPVLGVKAEETVTLYETLYRYDPESGNDLALNNACTAGSLLANAVKGEADLAFVYGSSVLTDIPAGTYTDAELLAYFDTSVEYVYSTVTGQTIYDLLNNSYSSWPNESETFLQTAGITYQYNVKSGVVENVLFEGRQVDPLSTYTIVCPADLLSGESVSEYDFSTYDKGVMLYSGQDTVRIYRLYDSSRGEHFYTADEEEKSALVAAGWTLESIGWNAPAVSTTPVNRLYNHNAGEHHYTTSAAEVNMLVNAGWKNEGIRFYSDDNHTVSLYREYNPNAFANNHNYTMYQSEHVSLLNLGWRGETSGLYGFVNHEGYDVNNDPDVIACNQKQALIHSLDALKSEMTDYLNTLNGSWSMYVENLNTGISFSINNSTMASASLIKLFTAGKYFDGIYANTISRSDYADNLLAKMISNSDNNAWTALETYIGNGTYTKGRLQVNELINRLGCSSSGRLVYEVNGETTNTTSVEDMGYVLREIYNGTYISAEASAEILSLMLNQQSTHKIPAGLPAGTVCANKTGELNSVQNDAAIVYSPACDYIIVIMCDCPSTAESWPAMRTISSRVYDYFNS